MSRRKSGFYESAKLNNYTWQQYYNRLTMIACSMFEWKNLPSTVDERYLELTLFRNGQVVFFKDEVLGYLALANAANGGFDVYGIPMNRRAYAVNGYNKELDHTNSVIIWNNLLHMNSALEVEMYAKRLYNIDRTIDINVNAQKTPVLIKCTEQERLTLLNMYKQYEGNEPFIFGDKSLNSENFTVLRTDAPMLVPQLSAYKNQLYGEALTVLGINNIAYEKRERLIVGEVASSQGGTIASRYCRLEPRREACKAINEMFGLDIWCDYREDYTGTNKPKENVEGDPDSEGYGGEPKGGFLNE